MPDPNYPQLLATLVGGGAMGALLTGAVTAFRNRRQPIGHRVDLVPVFKGTLTDSSIPARLQVTDATGPVHLDNLFVAEIQIVNRGNKDWPKLSLGITLSGGDGAIHVAPTAPDRHHKCDVSSPLSPRTPSPSVDFSFSPFNRGDAYQLRVYLVLPPGADKPSPIVFGSPEPVTFKPMPTLAELATEIGQGVSFRVGFLRVSFWS